MTIITENERRLLFESERRDALVAVNYAASIDQLRPILSWLVEYIGTQGDAAPVPSAAEWRKQWGHRAAARRAINSPWPNPQAGVAPNVSY